MHLLVVELGGFLPNTRVFVVLELEVRGQEICSEAVATLPRQKSGEVVNADDVDKTLMARRATTPERSEIHFGAVESQQQHEPVVLGDANGGVLEGGGSVVNGQGVVRVGDVTADVGDDGHLATLGQAFAGFGT